MYGHAYTPATISNISRAVEDHVKEFHERDLNKHYAVIYMDATYLNVRRDSVSKEALHILVNINLVRFISNTIFFDWYAAKTNGK